MRTASGFALSRVDVDGKTGPSAVSPDGRLRLQDIPRLEIPLHTLIELVPKPDGKMAETRISIDVDSDGPPQVPTELQLPDLLDFTVSSMASMRCCVLVCNCLPTPRLPTEASLPSLNDTATFT